jgi:hypothetical protein
MSSKLSFIVVLFLLSCSPNKESVTSQLPINPPAEGFNQKASDPVAIELADQVMLAMGGRKAWDDTRYIKWNFFGARRHIWDKHTGWVRVDNQRDELEIILNINSDPLQGKVSKEGQLVTDLDSLGFYLDMGRKMWINDSYWLVMPFKLKDSGVILSYLGTDTTLEGNHAKVVRLTFDQVGVTPQNAYNVWITSADSLVRQWSYFSDATDSTARFTRKWDDYQRKGNILLSGDRGGDRRLTEIEVLDSVDDQLFESFEVNF